MGDQNNKGGASALINSILKDSSPPEQEPPQEQEVAQSQETSLEPESDVASLIHLYFEVEEAEERDEIFDQIAGQDSPLSHQFLETMLHEDQDYFVRSAAAATLARRGHPDAVALLESDLNDPEEPFFFEQAVIVLGEIIAAPFYDTLHQIWRSEDRPGYQRREAMLGMEAVDAPRACQEFLGFLQGITTVENFPEEHVETALFIFARQSFGAAYDEFTRLEGLVAASSLEAEAQEAQLGFLQEARDLLSPGND